MALKLRYTHRHNPISMDVLDSELTSIKGGEVVGLTVTSLAGSDTYAYDSFDGYVIDSATPSRPIVTLTLTDGMRPLYLADDGTTEYGTLFGQVVGGTAGQGTSSTNLGPHTSTGSGKVTCWDEGEFAVSLDAVHTNASTGLTLTNTSLTAGSALYATSAGLLTPTAGSSFEANLVVGRFIEFTTNGSLVNTPNRLTQALNSPPGASALTKTFSYAVIKWNPPV